ncbi:nadh-ubiquinone oxidoreductase kda subunit [Stemphylium lycopersici]|uniref:Nadh-ubiquinone oxidoreductase kDa subunit n=1 Tax=Stemphylium lycopersici TaxID=183478 RepID=A0A364N8V4_STELY|nr:nadh-ubiquinone oxidoreductase kda subunit [Stemphylium lycopersici]RAR00858.1 nadh-ubiquinone oxidoreductase kda subunit [Stemphylium lycopersici]RAR13690.1 nadh-ubiquinone oxidoreductase kda subunit [Stemphylium lycopersici]
MRAAFRLLASVKPGQFLEAGTPTGLTGLLTHPSPRSSLLYHYNATLDKLKQIPESSVYRQSTEALTRHRLSIVEQSTPAGWKEWQEKIKLLISEDPTNFQTFETSGGQTVFLPPQEDVDVRSKMAEWDGEQVQSFPEGIRSSKERLPHAQKMKGDVDYTPERAVTNTKFEPEPQYTAEAISDLESRIGAGLIEEVIQVAEGEHKLVDSMIQAKVWEPLEEQAPEGQWSYFERTTHTPTTQKP